MSASVARRIMDQPGEADLPTGSGCARATTWRWLLVAVAALILMVPIVCNGYPLLYDDTTAYMRRSAGALFVYLGPGLGSEWLDPMRTQWLQDSIVGTAGAEGARHIEGDVRPWTSGRSVYYGFTVYLLTLLGNLWGPAAYQALIAGMLLYLCWFKVLLLRSVKLFVLMCAALACASSLGYFVGLIMPDVFAGFTILACALLLFGWDRLSGLERAFIFLIASFSVLAHDSHQVLAGALLGLALIMFARRGFSGHCRPAVSGIAALAACLVVGVGGNVAFYQTAVFVTGEPPMRLPHITAHMASLNPSVAYLKERCPDKKWTVCQHVNEMPIDWVEFMFGRPEIYDKATTEKRRRLSEEQIDIARSMLIDQPAMTLGVMSKEALKQLGSFSYYDLGQQGMLRKDVPEQTKVSMRDTLLVQRPALTGWLSLVQQLVVVLSLLPILLLIFTERKLDKYCRVREITVFVLGGILANAFVCGILASPYDRFQVRVVWLIPAMAMMWFAVLLERRGARRSHDAIATNS